MNKVEALNIISNCAKLYEENLVNRNLLFIYGSPRHPEYFESLFLPRNFLHLTGVKLKESIKSDTGFFSMVRKNEIGYNDIILDRKEIIERKLTALPSLMNIHNTAKMVGLYDSSRPLLNTDVFAGGVKTCLGFVDSSNGYFVPNTALKEDIRKLTKKPQQRILAVFRKRTNDKIYQEVCKTAKGIVLEDINFPSELKDKICLTLC